MTLTLPLTGEVHAYEIWTRNSHRIDYKTRYNGKPGPSFPTEAAAIAWVKRAHKNNMKGNDK